MQGREGLRWPASTSAISKTHIRIFAMSYAVFLVGSLITAIVSYQLLLGMALYGFTESLKAGDLHILAGLLLHLAALSNTVFGFAILDSGKKPMAPLLISVLLGIVAKTVLLSPATEMVSLPTLPAQCRRMLPAVTPCPPCSVTRMGESPEATQSPGPLSASQMKGVVPVGPGPRCNVCTRRHATS